MGEDEGWGAQAGRRRAGLPPWLLWGCGGGCLVLTLLGALALVVGWRYARESNDPEIQWPRLAQILAFDHRPERLVLRGFPFGLEHYQLEDPESKRSATLTLFPAVAREQAVRLLTPDATYPFGLGRPEDAVAGSIVVQGREVPCLRFSHVWPEPAGAGAGIRVNLGGITGDTRVLELRHPGSEPVEASEVENFLAPFDVWKDG